MALLRIALHGLALYCVGGWCGALILSPLVHFSMYVFDFLYILNLSPTCTPLSPGQLDQAAGQQTLAVREVTRQLDQAESEAARLKDRYVLVEC